MTHEERSKRRKAIADYLKEGMTIKQACEKFGVGESTVKNSAREHGVVPPSDQKNHQPSRSGYTALALLQNTHLSMTEIADKTGLSRQRVQQIFHYAIASGLRFPGRRYHQESEAS